MIVDEFAPAKVNLYLHIVGRRADGYHLLDSLVAFPAVGDTVAIEREDCDLALRVGGRFAAMIAGEADNLVLRAARALAASAGRDANVGLMLDKNLPVASGIGGGSSDAAAALRLLARHWGVAVPGALPLDLGADVPVCMAARPRRMGGIGEVLTAVPELPDCGIVLVNPGMAVATRAVFRALNGPFAAAASYPAAWHGADGLAEWLAPLRNDLEAPAVALCPAIAEVLAALRGGRGCLLARMSGSGATCFGLFPSVEVAERVAGAVRREGWWSWGGALNAPGKPRGLRSTPEPA